MTEPIAYLNGKYIPASSACLPLNDAGFLYGATVSDVFRTFKHRLYRLGDHVQRFQTSCRCLGIPISLSDSELMAIAERVASSNLAGMPAGKDLALSMVATPGVVSAYMCELNPQPTLVIQVIPIPFQRNATLFETGAHLIVPAIRFIPADCVDPRIKQRSRVHWWLAEQEARAADSSAHALLLDHDGRITETAFANFLVVHEGTIVSPPLSSVLNGVSLQVVRELAADLNIPFIQQPLTLYDCLNADEAMLTGSSFCVAGVSRINGTAIPWPGPTFQKLLSAWSERVGVDIARQTLSNR